AALQRLANARLARVDAGGGGMRAGLGGGHRPARPADERLLVAKREDPDVELVEDPVARVRVVELADPRLVPADDVSVAPVVLADDREEERGLRAGVSHGDG